MQKKLLFFLAIGLLIAISVIGIRTATAGEFVPGNPDCQDLGFTFGFKLETSLDGKYYLTSAYGIHTGGAPDDPNNFVMISNSDGTYFDWMSSLGMDAVIVKGGPNANVYEYVNEAFSDTGLHPPINTENGKPYSISHLEFCYDYNLDVSKTAEGKFKRSFEWDIHKSVVPEEWNLFKGDSGTSKYTVEVEKLGYTDSDWSVVGVITIENNTPLNATILSVMDVVQTDITADVDCGVTFPYVLPAGGMLECSYSADLPDATSRMNKAAVTTKGKVAGGVGHAAVEFGDPTELINAEVSVDDTNGMNWGPVSESSSWTYEKIFACKEGGGKLENTATIVETGQSDTASVTVNCFELQVKKDAKTSYDREYKWSIDKSVSPEKWDLFSGDSGTSLYTVAVTKTGIVETNLEVNGFIHIHNPAPIAAVLDGVTDVVSPDIAAQVDCGVDFPYELAADGTLECQYTTELPDKSTRTNTGTATLQNFDYDYMLNPTPGGTTDFTAEAGVDFSNAEVNETNKSINVTDTNGLSWGPVSENSTWSYKQTFVCDDDKGTHNNVATITETGQSDSASVTVNCYAIKVKKNADPNLTRKWKWTIDKTGTESSLTLSLGQTYNVGYFVEVTAMSSDADWAVSGGIWVSNPAPIPAVITAVSDLISPDIAGYVDCGVSFPFTLPAGDTLHCTYTAELPDGASRTNTATATLQNYDYDFEGGAETAGTTDFSGSAAVDFSNASMDETDECITVSDNLAGELGEVCASNGSTTFIFEYTLPIGPFEVCGKYTVENIANFVTNDTETTGSDNWVVNVDVLCGGGCTLTPGYWKTHSKYGPAPYDSTWAQIGEDTPFFLSGQSYYQVLWTSPRGNAYFILAHAYIAAELNFLNGADPSAAQAAFDQATILFQTYTPAQVADKNAKELRAQFISLAEILDNYNNGYIGPGHCPE